MTSVLRHPALVVLALVATACSAASAEPAPRALAPSAGRSVTTAATTTTTVAGPNPIAAATTTPWVPGPPPERTWVDFGAPEPEIDESLFVEYRVRVDPLQGTIALTFDDGPEPDWTPIILDILQAKGVTATFFVLGWKVDAYPELARRIVDEGHSLQSHAYRHHNLTARSNASVGRLIDDTARAISDATGTTPVCLRPPAGASSRRVAAVAAERGHEIVLWSPNGNTADYAHGSRSVVLNRARNWQPGDVALMHDTWGWIYRDVLGQMIDELMERGIGFSTICVREEVPPDNRL